MSQTIIWFCKEQILGKTDMEESYEFVCKSIRRQSPKRNEQKGDVRKKNMHGTWNRMKKNDVTWRTLEQNENVVGEGAKITLENDCYKNENRVLY